MLEKPNLADDAIKAVLLQDYALAVPTLDFLPRGQDSEAGGYRVVTEEGTAYFLKASARLLYEPSYFVPRYLADLGITGVVAPLPTKNKSLWVATDRWRIALYPFIAGISGTQPAPSAKEWFVVGQTFKQIHQMELPPQTTSLIRQESFDLQPYFDWISTFEAQPAALKLATSPAVESFRASWQRHHNLIQRLLATLEKLAGLLQKQASTPVICHGDLHGGNLIRTPHQEVFVVDWDEVLLAPKERDFIFVFGFGFGSRSGSGENTSFFEGYGESKLDWTALTYYQCERAVQDLIEYARIVYFRTDLSEQTKGRAVERFERIFGEGGMVEAASFTSSHLEPDLRI